MLPRLLASFGAAARAGTELVHVDNCSSDDTCELAHAWPGRLLQIRNERNVGLAAALRQAAEVAGGEFLLQVNPDATFEPGALEVLLDRVTADERVGAAGPKLVYPSGSVEPMSARQKMGMRGVLVSALGLFRVVVGTPLDPLTYPRRLYDVERDVACLSGAALLLRREALKAVGGVDDRWFMYFEDRDLCERLGKAGWRLRYCPAAVVEHIGAASSPRTPQLNRWLKVHSAAAGNLFLLVHRRHAQALMHRGFVFLGGAARLVASLVLAPVRPRQARWYLSLGSSLMLWALTLRMPRGAPDGSPQPLPTPPRAASLPFESSPSL